MFFSCDPLMVYNKIKSSFNDSSTSKRTYINEETHQFLTIMQTDLCQKLNRGFNFPELIKILCVHYAGGLENFEVVKQTYSMLENSGSSCLDKISNEKIQDHLAEIRRTIADSEINLAVPSISTSKRM